MSKIIAVTGNEAVAYAMKQINPDVVAAYPITPQTALMQKFADYVADGDVDTELVLVESEHSAMSACVGASAAGARTMTATAANGLALMWEILYCASGNRLPIVMPVVNRALSAPINIHCDHSDTMGARDAGWIQIFSENAQEAYDSTIQAILIAENDEVLTPTMVTLDGFIISHTLDRLETLDDAEVSEFVGSRTPRYQLLDTNNPVTFGPLDLSDYYFEHKRQQIPGMENGKKVIIEVAEKFAAITGRKYGYLDCTMMDDADVAIVCLGSTAGSARHVVKQMRSQGIKAGLVKIRVFRPFMTEEVQAALANVKAVAVMDRSDSFGSGGGPLYHEVRSALYGQNDAPAVTNYIYGLGGRNITEKEIERVIRESDETAKTGKIDKQVTYLGVRETADVCE